MAEEMRNRKHIKTFQSDQYNVANERIKKAAWLAFVTLNGLDYHYKTFKRYQLI